MASEQYISVRETAQLLGITEKKVVDLLEDQQLKGYKIANQFLRLKRTEVIGLRTSGDVQPETKIYRYTPAERLKDFFHYNDFYLISAGIVLTLLYVIFYT